MGDVGREPPLADDLTLERVGHLVDGCAQGGHLVAATGIDAGVEVTGGNIRRRGRRAPQPRREPRGQGQPEQGRGEHRDDADHHQLIAEPRQRALVGHVGLLR